VRSNCNALIK